jgi:3',5'-cyclic AMP phosphodiesterase CpdA
MTSVSMTQDRRILQVSDLHLSAARGYYQDNWELVLEWIEAERPDFVVVSGDLGLSDPDLADDLVFARTQLDRISVPWRAIPGNHDIGDNVVSGSMPKRVNAERRQRWLDIFGVDYWREEQGDWTLIGVNSQILNSQGLAAEDEQAQWLSETLRDVPDDRPIALFLHKPLFTDHPSETLVHATSLELAARQLLMAPFVGKSLRMVACGHKHQYRSFGLDGVIHLWAPSTGVINHPPDVKMWGLREVGFLDIRLGERGIRQRMVGSDFLFRHESYVRILEHGSVLKSPEQPIAQQIAQAAE